MNFSLYNEEWQKGDYHPQVVAYYFREWKENIMYEQHTHNQVEIMYAISGTCIIEAAGKQHYMKKGDFILLDANAPHRLWLQKGEKCRMLNVEFIFRPVAGVFPSIKQVCEGTDSLKTLLSLKEDYMVFKDPDEVYHCLKGLVMELDEGSDKKEFMIQLLMSELLIKISKLASDFMGNSLEAGGIHVRKALNYIHQHYDCEIQAVDIASAINIHSGYLHRIFKANTGTTIVEYLTRLRIDKAKMLLSHTDIPIIDISNYIGINSRQYFTYVFKRHTGITPLEFRRSVDKFKGFADEKVRISYIGSVKQ